MSNYRSHFGANARVKGEKRIKPKDLIKDGKFTVPKDADGEYEITATISADVYEVSIRSKTFS